METKQELLDLKSGIEKLLNMKWIFYNGFSVIGGVNCSGLCYLVILANYHNFITYLEKEAIEELLQNYGESKGFCDDEYFWPKEEWQPREEWLKQELKKVNQKLEVYGKRITRKKKSSSQKITGQ